MASTARARSSQLAISFDEAPLWDNASLEAALVREACQPLQLTLTDNRSVLLSFCRKHGSAQLPLRPGPRPPGGPPLLPGKRPAPRGAASPPGGRARPQRPPRLPLAGVPRRGGALPATPGRARGGKGNPAVPAARQPAAPEAA